MLCRVGHVYIPRAVDRDTLRAGESGDDGDFALGHFQQSVLVGDIEVAGRFGPNPGGSAESGARRSASGAAKAVRAVARESRDDTGRDGPDAVVTGIRDQHISGAVDRHADRVRDARRGGQPAVALVTRAAIAREGVDCAARDHPDAVHVGDEQVAVRIYGQSFGRGQLRFNRESLIAESRAAACHRRHRAASDLAHACVLSIGDVHRAEAVRRHAGERTERGGGRRTLGCARREIAGSRNTRQNAVRDLQDAPGAGIRDVYVPGRVQGDALRRWNLGPQRRTVLLAGTPPPAMVVIVLPALRTRTPSAM